MQYFFSFFLVFLVEVEHAGNAILLLDEPGLHMHPTAQQRLVGFLQRLSAKNQTLYSTLHAISRRLGLTFPVIADPAAIIATQFNLVGPPTGRAWPGWFVLDRTGRVRALDRGKLPRGGFAGVAFRALSIPAPDAARSASSPKR